MEPSPTESITGVLQATVFQVCQQIIPYSKELVVSGVVTIEADGKEFCSFSMRQATDKDRPPSRLQLISQALNDEMSSKLIEKDPKKPERPPSRSGRPPSRQCTRPPSRQQKDNKPTEQAEKDDQKPRSSSRLAAKGKNSPESEKPGLPKPNIQLPSINVSGSPSSLVNTLVAEAMKLWYDEGPSPDRLMELKKDRSDPYRSAAAELSLEAVRQWGQISPETLEAAAQLRRLGEQAAALAAMHQEMTQTSNEIQSDAKKDQNEKLPEPVIQFNEPAKSVRPRRRKGKGKDLDSDTVETPIAPSKSIQPRRHRFQSESKDIPTKNSKGMYECPACGKEFTFSTNLTRHQRNFHGRPYTRKTKDMRHGSEQDWLTEALSENQNSNEEPTNKESNKGKDCFVCAICFAKFETETQMDEHQNTAHSDNSMDEDSINCNIKGSHSASPAESTGSRPRRSPRSTVIANREKRQAAVDKTSPKSISGKRCKKSSKAPDADLVVIDIDGEQSPTLSEKSSQKGTPPKNDNKGGAESIDGKYSCNICGRNFPLYRNLGRHLKSTHGVSIVDMEMQGIAESKVNEQKNTCSMCGVVFTFSANLARHMDKVHNVSQKECKNKVKPGKGEASKENEPSNVQSTQKKEDRYCCDICGARFTFSANLSRHMKRTHKMIRKVVDTSPIVIPDESEAVGHHDPRDDESSTTGNEVKPPGETEKPMDDQNSETKQNHTAVSVVTEVVGTAPMATPVRVEPITGASQLFAQPQSLFRPISFGSQPPPVFTSAATCTIPTIKTSPITDKEVADALCSKLSKKLYTCSICHQTFGFQQNLHRHMKAMHGGKDDYLSAESEKNMHYKLDARPMYQSSLPPLPSVTVPLIVPVPLQPISFSPKSVVLSTSQPLCGVESPLGSPDANRHRHVCIICNASFTFRTNLTRHMKKQHGQVPPSIEIDSIVSNDTGQVGSSGESPTSSPSVVDSSPQQADPVSVHNIHGLVHGTALVTQSQPHECSQ